MIYINYEGPDPKMLHTKFHRNRFTDSRVVFKGFYHIYGHGGHLGHVTWTIYTNINSPFLRIPHKDTTMALIGEVVSEKINF